MVNGRLGVRCIQPDWLEISCRVLHKSWQGESIKPCTLKPAKFYAPPPPIQCIIMSNAAFSVYCLSCLQSFRKNFTLCLRGVKRYKCWRDTKIWNGCCVLLSILFIRLWRQYKFVLWLHMIRPSSDMELHFIDGVVTSLLDQRTNLSSLPPRCKTIEDLTTRRLRTVFKHFSEENK